MSEPEQEEERALRALLERAVPQLPAPAQRLERVRERARRRGRWRAAAMSATAVVAAALAGLAMPAALHRQADADRPVTSAPAAAPGTAPDTAGATTRVATRAPTSAPDRSTSTWIPSREVEFTGLGVLSLRLPAAWSTAETAGVGFASDQSLSHVKGTCTYPLDGYCAPLSEQMPQGGTLLVLQESHNRSLAKKLTARASEPSAMTVLKSCRSLGGTVQLQSLLADRQPAGSDVVVQVTLCLARPTEAQLRFAEKVVLGATFT